MVFVVDSSGNKMMVAAQSAAAAESWVRHKFGGDPHAKPAMQYDLDAATDQIYSADADLIRS